MKRCVLAVALGTLFLAPAASAGAYAKVVGPTGRLVSVGAGSGFRYPADGSVVQIGAATASGSGESLTDVQLLGGMVHVSSVDVFANGHIALGSIAAAGRVISPTANELVPLGPVGYLIVNQQAVSDRQRGRLALRLVLQQAVESAPAGTEILIGTPFVRSSGHVLARAGGTTFDPLAVLGLSPVSLGAVGFTPPPSLGSGSIGERAVAIAEQFLDVPYVWGGASPIPGFDCSGLAMYVYAQLGVKLTHYTGAQYFEGLHIPLSDIAPGDLLFFDQDPILGPQHEGIYIGDGRFIQAPHTGDVVKISNLSAYGLSFVGAVRPYDRAN